MLDLLKETSNNGGAVIDQAMSFKIAIQLIERIKVLHELGILYCDIELSGLSFDQQETLLGITDFSKVKGFLKADCSHVAQEFNCGEPIDFNLMFASLNACRRKTLSRRDDIESAFYLLIYLLNDMRLPWSELLERSASHDEDVSMRMRLLM